MINTFGVINTDGELVETITTGQTLDLIRAANPGFEVKPVEEWTEEQRATYWDWKKQ